MFSVKDYICSMKSSLEANSDELVKNLKNVFAYNFYSGVDLLDFEAFIEETRFEISIRMQKYWNHKNKKYFLSGLVNVGKKQVERDLTYHHILPSTMIINPLT